MESTRSLHPPLRFGRRFPQPLWIAPTQLGMGVILDVVYNHLGPDGNYFSRLFASTTSPTNMRRTGARHQLLRRAQPARARLVYRQRGLLDSRISSGWPAAGCDAEHLRRIEGSHPGSHRRAKFASRRAGRGTVDHGGERAAGSEIGASPEKGGYGLDALWNDDLHHTAMVRLTGHNEAYYTDYCGTPQEFVSAAKYGYLYQGQWYKWQSKRRGSPSFGVKRPAFVNFHSEPRSGGQFRPGHARPHAEQSRTPQGHDRADPADARHSHAFPRRGVCVFQSVPLFCRPQVRRSAPWFAKDGASFSASSAAWRFERCGAALPIPAIEETFRALQAGSFRARTRQACRRHPQDDLRHSQTAAGRSGHSLQGRNGIDGAVLSPDAFVIRYFGMDCDDRLLIVNFGRDLKLNPAPEPLLAPPEGSGMGRDLVHRRPALRRLRSA